MSCWDIYVFTILIFLPFSPFFITLNTYTMFKNLLLFSITLFSGILVRAQCSSGEVEVQIEINTDSYGSEGFWELVSADSTCGQGTILSGGNSSVGCQGAGAQNQQPGGYSSNTTVLSTTACLIENESYRIAYVDDWGDGGFEFFVYINGYLVAEFEGAGGFEYFTFQTAEPPAFDLVMLHPHVALYQPQGDIDIEAEVYNFGKDTITSVDLSYSIDGGNQITQTVSGLSIVNGDRAHIVHPTPWTVNSDGEYELVISAGNLNGTNVDANPNDNEVETSVYIGPDRPNIIDSYLLSLPLIVEIADGSDKINIPTDLDFHPILTKKELWVLNKDSENEGSSTVTISNAGETNQSELWRRDGNAWHFMSLSTGIAFSENGNFGTSPGVYDANHNGGQAFTGPALWSSDPDIYAQPSGGNGSHLDMLHQSPECQGIAHETENVFWLFDGYNKDIVRYDFVKDHGPGNDDHSDGEVLRFSEEKVKADSDDDVPSHLEYDKETDWLYVVDYGNARVFKIDTKSGSLGGTPTYGPYEPLAQYRHVVDYTWESVVDTGLIEPSGIALMGQFMLISDYATGEIIIYDRSISPAAELKRLKLESEGLMGITIGPNGHIWYVDNEEEAVNRLDWVADSTLGVKNVMATTNLRVYPNPSNGEVTLQNLDKKTQQYVIYNMVGQSVTSGILPRGEMQIDLDLAAGIYNIKFQNQAGTKSRTTKLVINK
jgi:DNA-binding beta-propeller fold protein YncE